VANKTREDIKNQIYDFLPKINQTGKQTLINNCIDMAVEEISRKHDFRALRPHLPDEATLAASAYYLDLNSTNFTTMCSTSVYLKDIRSMFWRKSTGDDYGRITFLDDQSFHERYGYYDYSSRDTGYPIHYTRLKNRLIFNCPAYEALTIRCFYQELHPPFSGDSTAHSFGTDMNMTAFFAITYRTLMELKSSLSSLEFPQELSGAAEMAQKYFQDMVDADKSVENEEFSIGWSEREERSAATDPYDWA
jgi:hypothetical protein